MNIKPNMAQRKPHRTARKKAGPGSRSSAPAGWIFGRHAESAAELAGRLPAEPVPEIVDRAELDRLLAGAVHQGWALLADPLAPPDLPAACATEPGRRNLVVVLDQVTDPQNVGAVLRSAAAFGARAVVATDRHAPAATGALAKAASGALETVALVRVANLARALEQLADLDYWRIGLDPAAAPPIASAERYDNVALVLGAEGKGLRRLTARHCDLLVRIPMAADMASLNVAAAAAVALYAHSRPD